MTQEQPLIVFDCDYTLWPFDCGKELIAPFIPQGNRVVDRWWRLANPYPEVRTVFEYIHEHKMSFAIASRNPSADSIRQLLYAIKIKDTNIWDMLPAGCFHAYSSGGAKGKTLHFTRISQATGRPLSDMLFFDDLSENIEVALRQGVTCVQILPRIGLTMSAFMWGLDRFSKKKAAQKIEAATPIEESPPNEVQASVSEG